VTRRVTISGEWIDRVVGLDSAIGEVVYLELSSGPRLELIRYVQPQGAHSPGLEISNTRGLRHLAFRVADLGASLQILRDNGVQPLGDPQTVPREQVTYADGIRKQLVYFRDPEGNLLELCEYRAGKD